MNAANPRKQIAYWLLTCCAMVLVILVVGGITRLTQSGLSITQWEPIRGVIPPLSEEAWHRYFELYRDSPEYRKRNLGMSLEEFKGIFWWEYIHRMVARIFGLVLVIPMAYFALRRRLRGMDLVRALVLLVLVAAQAVLGWAMVQTGLADRPYVSHHHLAAHLGLAFVLFGFMLWWALRLLDVPRRQAPKSFRRLSVAFAVLVFVQSIWGGFVAGLQAGYLHNTFPKMGEHWIYPDVGTISPFVLDLTSNPHTVQFVHRLLGVFLVLLVIAIWFYGRRIDVGAPIRRLAGIVAVVTIVQLVLGVATLLMAVPLAVAVTHQAVGLVLFGLALWLVVVSQHREVCGF